MKSILQHFIETQRANGYDGFKGAVIYGAIPMRQEVVNEIIRETVLKENDLVKQMHLAINDQNQISVNLTLRRWILSKNFNLELYIDPKINFPNSPKIRIWLAPSHWFLGKIAQLLTSLFGPLAAGVQVRGQLIEVDLKAILRHPTLSEIVRLVRSAEIQGQRGLLLLKFQLEVE
jgi:hypothetical protein